MATGSSQHCELRYFLPDGRHRHFESQGSVIRGQDGTVASVLVVSRDITERKLVEERLRLLEAAVHNANEAVIITTTDLSAPGPEIVFVNPAFS